MQHIMVAHDLSDHAALALGRAAQLAQQQGARLTLLHVQEDHLPAAVLEQGRTAAQAVLRTQLAELQVPAEIVIVRGRPAQMLVAQQRAREADLLVMGDHHQDSALYFAGTTLERVLQHSSAPVLLAVNPDLSAYQVALVPMDFSRCACRALHAARLLLDDQARIHALHVLEQADVHGADADDLSWQTELFSQLIADEQASMPVTGGAISQQLLQGELHSCVAQVIAEQRPQLLALGKNGRGEMADALLGSVARYYLQQPPCDLLLVK